MGIEPTQSAWKADVLPLNYTRVDLKKDSRKERRIQEDNYNNSNNKLTGE